MAINRVQIPRTSFQSNSNFFIVDLQNTQKKLIVVLGMHRSGTSAITRSLRVLGVELGNQMHPGTLDDNAKGFWEDLDVLALNQEILFTLGHDWDIVAPIPSELLESDILNPLRVRAKGLLASKIESAQFFGLKDPRLSLLLPFWSPIFESLNLNVAYVIALRNPISVVKSLKKRDGMLPHKSYMLWVSYMSASMLNCRGKCLVVDYDLLLDEPDSQLFRISSVLGLPTPALRNLEFSEFKNEFIDMGLRHTKFDSADLEANPEASPLVREAFALLHQLSRIDSIDSPESTLAWFNKAQKLLSHPSELVIHNTINKELAIRSNKIIELESIIEGLNSEIVRKNSELSMLMQTDCNNRNQIDKIKKSLSWRITSPLRFALRVFKNRRVTNNDLMYIKSRIFRLSILSWPRRTTKFNFDATARQDSTSLELKPQSKNTNDVFVWGVIDWHFRLQRPQHLASQIAKMGRRVFYFSNDFINTHEAGFHIESLDTEGTLFQVKLHVSGAPSIYAEPPSNLILRQLQEDLAHFIEWTDSNQIVNLVQHPFWYPIVSILPNSRLVYDCMDHHEGFGNVSPDMLSLERRMAERAELLVVTSQWLDDILEKSNPHRWIIRNACDFEHFAQPPQTHFHDKAGRKIIGYYGAIADWFDLNLIKQIASSFSDCLVLLIGADTCNAQAALANHDNILFTGEVPYRDLPFYLYAIDVCLLPFQVVPLTLATNPVKLYEYLSAGKTVVTVDLPEMNQFKGLIKVATNPQAFIDHVSDALATPPGEDEVNQRKQFAQQQTWTHRASELISALDIKPEPKVSIIVVTYNNLEITQACLHSLEQYSSYPNLEVIVVDNASDDGTRDYLRDWATHGTNRIVVLNDENTGFAAANNIGMRTATGDYFVLLNNDTYVTPGWLRTLLAHVRRDRTIGLIGPVTNNIGNEAKIEIQYSDMAEMQAKAKRYTREHMGQTFPLRTAAFFCVLIPRKVFEDVGPLDETFGRGFFEDDDYCRRVEKMGLRVLCAEDVFVHHQLSASFSQIKSEARQALFDKNKALYEAKWGKWVPHAYRG